MKIILLGYMGSGKSTVAKGLSKSLKMPYIDLDDYIVKKENKSIKDLFASKGEIYFRLQESKYLNEILASEDDIILALGGGTPCYGNNMELIKNSGLSIYLKASIATICNRLRSEKDQRPLIASLNDDQLTEYVAKHLFERRNFYELANHSVSIDQKTIDGISQEILDTLKK